MTKKAFLPADLVNHPSAYEKWVNPKAYQKMTSFQEKSLYVLSVKDREFLDSIYEPRDLTCWHKNEEGEHFQMDVAHWLMIANARNDGSLEWESLELEYWMERPLIPKRGRPKKRV